MPTENRSSNTEMVSFPRELSDELAELIATRARVCGGGAYDIWEAICAEFGQPAQQHQGEPVAVVDEGDDGLFVELIYGDNGNPLRRGDKLYTHPAPADTAEVEHAPECFCVEHGLHIETLRAQLADLVSAVRSINYGPTHAVQVPGDDEPCYPQRKEWIEWLLGMCAAASAELSAPLPPVAGDILPPVGSQVLIHLAREDKWVEHTVVGYYAWENLRLDPSVYRVFVRVRDADGYLNARGLGDIRPIDSAAPQQ